MRHGKSNLFKMKIVDPLNGKTLVQIHDPDNKSFFIKTRLSAEELCTIHTVHFAQNADYVGVVVVCDASSENELCRAPILRLIKGGKKKDKDNNQ